MNSPEAEVMKFIIHAPCVEYVGHRVKSAPCVDCLWNCEECGWNPREKERRLTEGRWINGRLIFSRRKFNGIG